MPSISHRPFYRAVLQDAWNTAWRERRWWLMAVGAGVLQTGGIIDVLLRLLREHLQRLPQLGHLPFAPLAQNYIRLIQTGVTTFAQTIIGLRLLQALCLALLFGVAFISVSILCQGALVYVIGVRGRFTTPGLQEAFGIAGKRFWSVAALNLLPITAFVFGWFVLLAPFGSPIPLTSVAALLGYVLAVFLAIFLGFAATALHMLALQRVVLDVIDVKQALREAWILFRRSWFVILEAAVGMFALGVALFMVSLVGFAILCLPILALVGMAIVFQMPSAVDILLLVCELLFVVSMLAVGGFMITLQYTLWHRLFSRLAKGMAVSKVTRTVHDALEYLHDLRSRR